MHYESNEIKILKNSKTQSYHGDPCQRVAADGAITANVDLELG
jgi:hypothetical protein